MTIDLTDEDRAAPGLFEQVKQTLPYQLGYADGLAVGRAQALEDATKAVMAAGGIDREFYARAIRALK